MTLVWLLMVFALSLFIPSVSSEPKHHVVGKGLEERMNRLEKLVLRLNIAIQKLQAENDKFKGQLKNQDSLQMLWEVERQSMKDEIKHLQDRLKAELNVLPFGSQSLTEDSLDTVRVFMPRADDVNALEPVVTQMAQRLIEVTAEVQAMKTLHNTDIQTLRDAIGHHDQTIQEAGNSVYVRWGSSLCPNSTSLVYSGVVGGSYYTHTGAATNHLCLSLDPVLSDHPLTTAYSYLYGAEYWTYDVHQAKDPVCAVCRSPRPTNVMVPGTDRCQAGWTTEYSGYLMAGYRDNQAGTQYICVDSQLGSRMGGDTQNLGDHLFFVVTQCGSLPCEPYVNNKVVTCVVCSK